MQTLKIALTIIVALFLQLVLPKQLSIFQYVDLPLIVTVYFSLQRAPVLGMLTGLLSGLGGDLIGGGIPGVGGFSKTLIGYLISMTSIKFSLQNVLMRLVTLAVASAANTVLYVVLYQMLEHPLPFAGTWGVFGRTLGWKVLGDLIAGFILFLILDRVYPEQVAAQRMAIKRRFYE